MWQTHPESLSLFLEDFVSEVKTLQKEGIIVGSNNHKKPFSIRLFSCDAPARSFISATMGHASLRGCSKCTQVGI